MLGISTACSGPMWSPGATLVAVGEEAKDQPEQSVKPAPGVLPTVSQDATVTQRAYFSAQAILAATRSARLADDIESDHPGDWGDPHVSEHLQAVTSAIVYSATFLEALVNEWYTDAAEPNAGGGDGIGRSRGLEARTVDLMAGWRQRTGRQHVPPLLKYQFLLLFADRSQLDEAEEPYQSADLVVKLRNRIIHFEPHTITMDPAPRRLGLCGGISRLVDFRCDTHCRAFHVRGEPYWMIGASVALRAESQRRRLPIRHLGAAVRGCRRRSARSPSHVGASATALAARALSEPSGCRVVGI